MNEFITLVVELNVDVVFCVINILPNLFYFQGKIDINIEMNMKSEH